MWDAMNFIKSVSKFYLKVNKRRFSHQIIQSRHYSPLFCLSKFNIPSRHLVGYNSFKQQQLLPQTCYMLQIQDFSSLLSVKSHLYTQTKCDFKSNSKPLTENLNNNNNKNKNNNNKNKNTVNKLDILDSVSNPNIQLDYGAKKTIAQTIVLSAPDAIRPYLHLIRLDRPIGSWLLFWPCGWSLAIAAQPGCFPDPTLLAIFAVGTMIMRGAGCTINDMWDSDFDSKVARTASRPLACGAISQFDALVFLGLQLGFGCLVLLQLNWFSILLGASSLGLVLFYPLMKRVTYWPQLILGFAFNWGALLGWAAVHGTCDWFICLPLYFAGLSWTLIYDTIYAHQDKEDDLIVGIKSTALKFGDSTQKWLSCFTSIMMINLVITGYSAQLTWPYYLAITGVAVHLANQIKTLKINDAQDCGNKFRTNRHIGLLLFLGIVGGVLMKESNPGHNKCDNNNNNNNNVGAKDNER